jgi:c-di-AMP phosphodiesterase-like protein
LKAFVLVGHWVGKDPLEIEASHRETRWNGREVRKGSGEVPQINICGTFERLEGGAHTFNAVTQDSRRQADEFMTLLDEGASDRK